jgi:GNAT superfamily N-acetyltransferase
MIDLYAAAPLPCAPRGDWAAPAALSEAELDDLIEGARLAYDLRVFMPLDFRGSHSLRGFEGGSEQAHPASNALGGVRWTEAEADARIAAIVERYRARQIGFSWFVASNDTPADLGERLERHGLVYAGEAAKMVRLGLDDLETIPVNPRVTIERLDGSDEAAEAAAWTIIEVCFSWPPEMTAQARVEDRARYQIPALRREEFNYLARLDGQPVGTARLVLRAGAAYLGGAATLPEFRGQRVYSTLLRRRLEVARERGYHVALIDAEPMSRRVVTRYGFAVRGQTRIYGWMPVIDLDVIRSLVPQD